MKNRVLALGWVLATMLAYSQASAKIVDNGDGTATDTDAKLTWQVKTDGMAKTWDAAKAYCAGLTLADKTGWRMPDNDALFSLYNAKKALGQSSSSTAFPASMKFIYWSSTPFPNNVPRATYINFATGSAGLGDKSETRHVQCVR